MYAYAFLSSPALPLDLPSGIAGLPSLVQEASIAVLVEPEIDLDRIEQNDERLIQAVLCHDRVVRAAFEQTTVLPLRFGTCFVSKQKLLEHLQVHEAEYQQKLAVLSGKAEYGLRLTALEPAELSVALETTGKAYFLAKKQRYQALVEQQQQQQAELQQILGAIAQTHPESVSVPAQDGVERVYLLSDRQRESDLYQHLQDWQMQSNHWQLQLGEALPPYHFV